MLSTERNKGRAGLLIKHKRIFGKRDPPYTRERPEGIRVSKPRHTPHRPQRPRGLGPRRQRHHAPGDGEESSMRGLVGAGAPGVSVTAAPSGLERGDAGTRGLGGHGRGGAEEGAPGGSRGACKDTRRDQEGCGRGA